MYRLWTRWAVMCVATALVPGCSDQGPGEGLLDQVDAARQLWQGSRPQEYVYDLERLCTGCTSVEQGPVTVRVSGTTVVELSYTEGGGRPEPGIAAFFVSVDGLLDLVEEAIREGAYEVVARYDNATGVPLSVRIDYEPFVFDEERYYVVRRSPRAPGS